MIECRSYKNGNVQYKYLCKYLIFKQEGDTRPYITTYMYTYLGNSSTVAWQCKNTSDSDRSHRSSDPLKSIKIAFVRKMFCDDQSKYYLDSFSQVIV